jgi:hypothetical protein
VLEDNSSKTGRSCIGVTDASWLGKQGGEKNMQPIEGDLSFDELKNDVRALRESVASLNAEINQLRSATPARGRRIFQWPGLRRWWIAAAIPVLVLTAWAEAGNVALIIDKATGDVKIANALDVQKGLGVGQDVKIKGSLEVTKDAAVLGKMGIGTSTPEAKLDVGGYVANGIQAILARGADRNFQLTARNGDGNTQYSETARFGVQYRSASAWNSDFRFFRGNGTGDGRLGVFTDNRERMMVSDNGVDVKGEIRGRPWISQSYEWKQNTPSVKMTRVDRSVCFLTLVAGYFKGQGEIVEVVQKDNYWYLQGASAQADVRARAICIGAPDNSW